MYRKQLKDLSAWAKRSPHKPLVIRGARQVGKSTLVRLFAKQAGYKLLTINFERNPEHADVFKSKDPQQIISLLSLIFDQDIIEGKSLLFLDEIQASPEVLSTLRYFYEELPKLHLIAAGSLLDFELASPSYSMPVGRISYLHMGPMGFSEFLRAVGKDKLADFIEAWQIGEKIPEPLHNTLMQYLRQAMAVGGMPEVVAAFAKNGSYKECEEIKQDLLATFRDDFSKYSTDNQKDTVTQVFSRTPAIIGDKVKYSNISPHKKASEIAKAIELLAHARVISKVIRSSANGLPLSAEENPKFFKLLFLDTGLVSTMLNLSYQALQNEDLMTVNTGALAEQWVGQVLLHSQNPHQPPALNYWAREKRSSSAEVDYVIESGRYIVPVEVKAGKGGRLKSLHLFIEEKQSQCAVRFNADQPSVMQEPLLISLPLYMAGSIGWGIANNIK